MATKLKLKSDINKLKAAIKSKATPKSFVPKLKMQLEKAENELAALSKGGRPRKTSTSKGTQTTLSALQKLIQKRKFSKYQGAGVDLEKDASQGALKTGRRVSKGLKANQFGSKGDNKGNVYYEYRPNRLDVKQPKKNQRYPKLEDGGMMAHGGEMAAKKRLEELREELRAENISYSELAELQSLAKYIDKDDVELLEAAGVNEFEEEDEYKDGGMMAEGGEIKAGDYVIVDNPFWKASMRIDKPVRRKVKMVINDNVFFSDGSNSSIKYVKKLEDGGMMADGGELHRTQEKFADGGKVFSEKELKEILNDALYHFYKGLNGVELAMRYLEVKGQGGLKTPLAEKLDLEDLKESISKIDEYVSK